MKKLYTLIATAGILIVSASQSFAQCPGNRYHDYIFTTPTPISDITYGSNLDYTGAVDSLKLDVYQPPGDNVTLRPLVIIAHGGSFVGGSKTGTDVVPLCQNLTEMGYVTASIDYRLGMTNFPTGAHQVDSADAGAAVMRAVQDGRAAVRYFRKNARVGGNTYKIDTNNIYFAGVSAGSFIAIHLAYMNTWADFPSYIDTTGVTVGNNTGESGLHGGIQGASGNPGYPANVNAIVDICGAIADTAMMHAGNIPVLSFHGTADGTVPYAFAEITLLGVYPLLRVYGSYDVTLRATHLGIPNCMETWLGQDHVPEVSSAAYYDSTITITRTYLEHYVCGTAFDCAYTQTPRNLAGIAVLDDNINFNVYPNPANTNVTIDLNAFNGHTINIEMYDAMGRQVKNISSIKANSYLITRDNLSNGIYFMKVICEGKTYSKKIIFE